MKKFRYIVLLCLLVFLSIYFFSFIASPASARERNGSGERMWHWLNPLPQGDHIYDIALIGDDSFWVVGAYETVALKKGDAWVEKYQGENIQYRCVDADGEDYVLVGGLYGKLLFFDGFNWTQQDGMGSTHFYGVDILERGNAWAVGSGGAVFNFDGTAWSSLDSGTTSTLLGVHAISDNEIWMCGANGTLIKYDGNDFETFFTGINEAFYDVKMCSDGTGWAVGEKGRIFYFDGNTWSKQLSGTTLTLFGLSICDSQNAWVAGDSGTILHFNGTQWNAENTGTNAMLRGIAAVDENRVWAVGINGNIFFNEHGSWSNISSGFGNQLWAVETVDENHIWTAGANGTIFSYIDGSWSSFSTEANVGLRSISAISSSSVWVAGDRDTIIHWDGSSWTEMSTGHSLFGNPINLYSIHAKADDDIWATGPGGAVLHYDGINWFRHSVGATQPIYDVFALNDANVWVVGPGGLVIHYNGTVWTIQQQGKSDHLYSVWASSDDNVWAVGSGGSIYHFDGENWEKKDSPVSVMPLNEIDGISASEIFAVGQGGIILTYDGTQWLKEESWSGSSLQSISAYGDGKALASGSNQWSGSHRGTLLRRDEIVTVQLESYASSNGQINPSGSISMPYGESVSFDIIPDEGCRISGLLIDDSPTAISDPLGFTYNFWNAVSNHTISASFEKLTYEITPSAGAGGAIVPGSAQTVEHGDSLSFSIASSEGYSIRDVLVDGASVGAVSEYTFSNITSNHTISASFEALSYDIKLSVFPPGAGITTGEGSYEHGARAGIKAMAEEGYLFESWSENGNTVSSSSNYDFRVTSSRDLQANFIEEEDPPIPPAEVSMFYFAEGHVSDDFHEYLCLGNPESSEANVTVRYIFNDGSEISESLSVPPLSRHTLNVNSRVIGDFSRSGDVSLIVESESAFTAERPVYFNYKNKWTGGHNTVGAPALSNTWYFAEGYTGEGFEQWICVMNPSDADAVVKMDFQTQEEGEKGFDGFEVPSRSRRTFSANDILGEGFQASCKLSSNVPVVAERVMYFDYSGTGNYSWTGGHCVMGASVLANEYYFAEGTTRPGFEEWVTIQNPSQDSIIVIAEYHLAGNPSEKRQYEIDSQSRHTIRVEDEIGPWQDVSVHLYSESLFLAERPQYFRYEGMGAPGWDGGHCVIGATETSEEWFFAEGYTGAGFHEWLTIQNPNDSETEITITYFVRESGALDARKIAVSPHSRATVYVNDDAGANLELSCKVQSTHPVVIERPMYFSYGEGWTGGHNVIGYSP